MTKTATDAAAAAAAKRSLKRRADDCVASAATGRSVDDGLRQRLKASSTPEPGQRSKASGPVTSGVMPLAKVVGAPKPAAAPTRQRVASPGLALSTGDGCMQPAVPTSTAAAAKATRARSSSGGSSRSLATMHTSVTATKASTRRSEEPFSAPGATPSTASSDVGAGSNRPPIGSRQPKVAAVMAPDRHRLSDDDSGPAAVRRRRSSRDEFKSALPSSGRRVSRQRDGASAGQSCSSGGGGSKSPSGIRLAAPPLGAASDRRAAELRQPGGRRARRSRCCNSSGSSSSVVAALAGAAEASAAAAASGSSAATGTAKGRTSKRRQVSADVVEVDEPEIVVDLCTSPALPSTADGSISQTPLKTDRDLKGLTEEDLLRMIQKNHDHLKSIMTGQTPCQRHVEYGRGRKARRDLDKRVPLLLLTEEQSECIAAALLQAFCGTSLERADYMLRVLLPETLARIYMEVHSTTAAETEKLFSDMTADLSFLS